MKVWRALLRVPFGTLVTYGKLATAIGQPKAARAVGSAVGSNLLGIPHSMPSRHTRYRRNRAIPLGHRKETRSGGMGGCSFQGSKQCAVTVWCDPPICRWNLTGISYWVEKKKSWLANHMSEFEERVTISAPQEKVWNETLLARGLGYLIISQ